MSFSRENKSFFIAGTGTDVGKTYISALIVKDCLRKKLKTAYFKPLASGCEGDIPEDISFIKEKTGVDTYSLYKIREPVAPGVIIKEINIKRIMEKWNYLTRTYEAIIVEGIGGLLVPIDESFFVSDIIKMLKIPVILVGENRLGIINDTLLSVYYLKKENINFSGFLLNNRGISDFSTKTNASVLKKFIGKKFLGEIKRNQRKLNSNHTLLPHIKIYTK
jgi:dethiobiotin synthetase